MTASQIKLNIARTAIQALAAILGGAQSLHVNSYDEALGLPTEDAATLSVRIQQFLLLETDVAKSADPLGGSFMVEKLTDELEQKAEELIERIERMGGMLKAIESGFPQKEIERSSYEYQKRVESGEIQVLGVNKYREDERVEIQKIDPKEREKVINRLEQYRKERDKEEVQKSLSKVTYAAEKEDENLFPYVLQAIRNGATVGEISSKLREVWGEWVSQ
jgi:methylmalonyl-CoA mutase N-terminal domain/subunit